MINSLSHAIYQGYKIYGVAIQTNTASEECIVSVDGDASEKEVEMESCPTGSPWLSRKSWTMEAMEQIHGDDWYWRFENTASGYCLKHQYGAEIDEVACDTDNEFLFKLSDLIWNSANIIPKSDTTVGLMPDSTSSPTYVIDDSLTHTPTVDLKWNLFQDDS